MTRAGLKTVPMTQIARRLQTARGHDRDHYVHLGELRMVPGAQSKHLHERFALRADTGGRVRDVRFRSRSLVQFLSHLGIPAKYVARIPVDLALENVNRLLADRAEELVLLRIGGVHGDEVRALLKASFCRFSDQEILGIATDLSRAANLKAANVSILADSFHLRLITPERTINVAPGRGHDPVHTGIDIYNSETGHGSLKVRGLVYRQVCSNGMTINEAVADGLNVKLDRIDGDRVRRAFDKALVWCADNLDLLADRYLRTHEVALGDPRSSLDRFLNRHSLGRVNGRIGQLILSRLQVRNGLFGVTKFDLLQAVTEVSQAMTVTQRLRYEDAAGSYMLDGVNSKTI